MAAQIPFIWIAAVVVLVLLIVAASIFVKVYQDKNDRDAFVTTVCILSLTSLLATVCLLPVDIALVSTTVDNSTGLKKDWASPEKVHHIVLALTIVYYTLYSLNAVMCLVVVPFAYFWYEEWDVDTTTGQRIKGAVKYSIFFLALLVILLLVGLFIPAATQKGGRFDWEYFKNLLSANNGERALAFITGVLMCLGTVVYVLYTAPGLALTPLVLIKSVPTVSSPAVGAGVSESLAINRERQRMIEGRYAGSPEGPSAKDRRELEALQREELTLKRRERIASENASGARKWWHKAQAAGRPFKLLFGLIVLVVSLILFSAMLITSIDKIKNSPCGKKCGYILPVTHILNPINWLFVQASRVFPVDYVLALVLVLDFFVASVVGVAFIGIRFLWVSLFSLRTGSTKPQGLLVATVLLTLSVLAMNYAITSVVLPQYSHYGTQMYCSRGVDWPIEIRNCTGHRDRIVPCTETGPQDICTPTVVSTFINRISLNFPFFGWFGFFAQFAFLGIFLLTLVTGLIWTPRLGSRSEEEEAAEAEEEESLIRSTGRRFGAAWEDLRGSTNSGRRNGRQYGTAGRAPVDD